MSEVKDERNLTKKKMEEKRKMQSVKNKGETVVEWKEEMQEMWKAEQSVRRRKAD